MNDFDHNYCIYVRFVQIQYLIINTPKVCVLFVINNNHNKIKMCRHLKHISLHTKKKCNNFASVFVFIIAKKK